MSDTGRDEKRMRKQIPVRLADSKEPSAAEDTRTENVSPHGARVITNRAWRPDEQPVLKPPKADLELPARVTYCQVLPNGRFCIGLEFPGRTIDWVN
jgi:hypothetical protein